MAERRTLSEGLKATPPVDVAAARQFVYGGRDAQPATPSAGPSANSQAPAALTTTAAPALTRVPISTRIRSDLAAALKRASLERQLRGEEPNTLQDMLEQAIVPWLRSHDLLP